MPSELLLEIVLVISILVPDESWLGDKLGVRHEALHAFVLLCIAIFDLAGLGAGVVRETTKLAHLLQLFGLRVQ